MDLTRGHKIVIAIGILTAGLTLEHGIMPALVVGAVYGGVAYLGMRGYVWFRNRGTPQ